MKILLILASVVVALGGRARHLPYAPAYGYSGYYPAGPVYAGPYGVRSRGLVVADPYPPLGDLRPRLRARYGYGPVITHVRKAAHPVIALHPHRVGLSVHRPIVHHRKAVVHHPKAVVHHPKAVVRHPNAVGHHHKAVVHHPKAVVHHPKAVVHATPALTYPAVPYVLPVDIKPVKVIAGGACTGVKDGYLPDANCNYFHQCSNGRDYLMPCPYGLWWSQALLRCVYSTQSECDGKFPLVEHLARAPGAAVAHQPIGHQEIAFQPIGHQEIAHQPSAHQEIAHQPSAHQEIAYQPIAQEDVIHQPTAHKKATSDQRPADQAVVHQALPDSVIVVPVVQSGAGEGDTFGPPPAYEPRPH